jgi:hypothetical protein
MNREETRLLVENWRNLISVENNLEHKTIFLSESVLNEGMMEKIKSLGPKAAGLAFAMVLLNPFNSGEANATKVHKTIPPSQVESVMSDYFKDMGITKFKLKIDDEGKLLVSFENDVSSEIDEDFSDEKIKTEQEGRYYVLAKDVTAISAEDLKGLAAGAVSSISRFVETGEGADTDDYNTIELFDSQQDAIKSIQTLGSKEIEKRLDNYFNKDKKEFSGHKNRQYNSGFDQAGDYLNSISPAKRKEIIEKYGSENNFNIFHGLEVANIFQILDF